jgi:hypothetical protein
LLDDGGEKKALADDARRRKASGRKMDFIVL